MSSSGSDDERPSASSSTTDIADLSGPKPELAALARALARTLRTAGELPPGEWPDRRPVLPE